MAIDPVKIPANVQVEEKIVGPVGLRQLFLLLGTGGISWIIFSIVQKSGGAPPYQMVAWLPLGIGAAFAFVSINDISLLKLIFLQIEKMAKPARRTFGPRQGIEVNVRIAVEEKKDALDKKALPENDALAALTSTLDVGPVDPEEQIADGTITIGISEPNGSNIDGLYQSGEIQEDEDDNDQPFIRDILPPSRA